MATTYRVLGQVYPTALTLTTAYTVPSATQTIVSTIAINNQSVGMTMYSITIEPSGTVSTANLNYIARDAIINGNETQYITVGLTLNTADVVKVLSENGNVSFNLFGSEIA